VLKGVLEVLERDAFMLFWQRMIRCPELDVSSVRDVRVEELLDRTVCRGYRRVIRVLTLDIPISILLVAFIAEGPHLPRTLVAAAADVEPLTALRLALEEGLLSLNGITRLIEREPQYQPSSDYSNVNDLMQHAAAHAVSPELQQVMTQLLEPCSRIGLSELPRAPDGTDVDHLEWLTGQLERTGLETIALDVTTPDIDESGFKVVRVIVPGMQPLDIDHRYRHLNGPRLGMAPERLGLPQARCPAPTLNPYPHPFP
jgi:ribosomal protein S12 methylthiotransferase accessory factor